MLGTGSPSLSAGSQRQRRRAARTLASMVSLPEEPRRLGELEPSTPISMVTGTEARNFSARSASGMLGFGWEIGRASRVRPLGRGVGVGSGLGVAVGVGRGVAVGSGVGVERGVAVGSGLGVAVGAGVGVGGTGVAVGAGIGVGMGVGSGKAPAEEGAPGPSPPPSLPGLDASPPASALPPSLELASPLPAEDAGPSLLDGPPTGAEVECRLVRIEPGVVEFLCGSVSLSGSFSGRTTDARCGCQRVLGAAKAVVATRSAGALRRGVAFCPVDFADLEPAAPAAGCRAAPWPLPRVLGTKKFTSNLGGAGGRVASHSPPPPMTRACSTKDQNHGE